MSESTDHDAAENENFVTNKMLEDILTAAKHILTSTHGGEAVADLIPTVMARLESRIQRTMKSGGLSRTAAITAAHADVLLNGGLMMHKANMFDPRLIRTIVELSQALEQEGMTVLNIFTNMYLPEVDWLGEHDDYSNTMLISRDGAPVAHIVFVIRDGNIVPEMHGKNADEVNAIMPNFMAVKANIYGPVGGVIDEHKD